MIAMHLRIEEIKGIISHGMQDGFLGGMLH
jgi:hypothetical protein